MNDVLTISMENPESLKAANQALSAFKGVNISTAAPDIQKKFPGFTLAQYGYPTLVTADFRLDRIRIFLDDQNIIKDVYLG